MHAATTPSSILPTRSADPHGNLLSGVKTVDSKGGPALTKDTGIEKGIHPRPPPRAPRTAIACPRRERIPRACKETAAGDSRSSRHAGLASPHPNVAVDLGCGPGFTTRLLQQTTGAALTIGVDRSGHFLRLAAQSAPTLRFVRHDLTEGPPPVEPADVLFCHLLLSHLPDPANAIESWKSCITPTGVILFEQS